MDKQTFDKLAEVLGFDGAMELVQSVQAPKSAVRSSRPALAAKTDVTFLVGTFTDVATLVAAALDAKAVVGWSAAYAACFRDGSKFQSTRIDEVVAAFEAATVGASAIITDGRGNHHPKVFARHAAWLTAKGYEKLPGKKF